MSFKKQPKGYSSKAVHAGYSPEDSQSLSVIPPIITSSTFKQTDPGSGKGYIYTRYDNPTRDCLNKVLAALDNAKYGVTFASGLGSITAIFTLLKAGDHVICGDDVYGGTSRFIREIVSNFGMQYDFVDTTDLEAIKKAIKPNTKLCWIETPTNPLMKAMDIEAIGKIVHLQSGILFVVDNSFLTSYFQRPLEYGADIVMYSLTKYVNGHSDLLMGATITNSEDLYKKLKFIQKSTGIIPSAFDCYQVIRGLKTLSIRMDMHMTNGITLAKYLEKHPFVMKVLHPALPSHPQHELILRQCYGYSGVFSIYLRGTLENAKIFLKALKIFMVAESLGGYESLIQLPKKRGFTSRKFDFSSNKKFKSGFLYWKI
ncbi:CTH.2 family protein [Megaselia abdita]